MFAGFRKKATPARHRKRCLNSRCCFENCVDFKRIKGKCLTQLARYYLAGTITLRLMSESTGKQDILNELPPGQYPKWVPSFSARKGGGMRACVRACVRATQHLTNI